MNRFKTISLLVLATILLESCAGIPLMTAYKLRNLDPLTTDPANVRIAVITDKSIELTDGSAVLELGFTAENPELSLNDRYETMISSHSDPRVISNKISALGNNQHLILFELSPTDARAMRSMQEKIEQYRQNEVQGNGSLSVSITSGCFEKDVPNALLVDVYLMFSEDQGYLPLLSNMDLFEEARKAGTLDKWLDCQEGENQS